VTWSSVASSAICVRVRRTTYTDGFCRRISNSWNLCRDGEGQDGDGGDLLLVADVVGDVLDDEKDGGLRPSVDPPGLQQPPGQALQRLVVRDLGGEEETGDESLTSLSSSVWPISPRTYLRGRTLPGRPDRTGESAAKGGGYCLLVTCVPAPGGR
jgi:hypothetical protein